MNLHIYIWYYMFPKTNLFFGENIIEMRHAAGSTLRWLPVLKTGRRILWVTDPNGRFWKSEGPWETIWKHMEKHMESLWKSTFIQSSMTFLWFINSFVKKNVPSNLYHDLGFNWIKSLAVISSGFPADFPCRIRGWPGLQLKQQASPGGRHG